MQAVLDGKTIITYQKVNGDVFETRDNVIPISISRIADVARVEEMFELNFAA